MITKFNNFNLILEKSTLNNILNDTFVKFIHNLVHVENNVNIQKINNDRTNDILHNKIYSIIDNNLAIFKNDDYTHIIIHLKIYNPIEYVKEKLDKMNMNYDELTYYRFSNIDENDFKMIDLKEKISKKIVIFTYSKLTNKYYLQQEFLDDFIHKYFYQKYDIFYISIENIEKYNTKKYNYKELERIKNIKNILINYNFKILLKMMKSIISAIKKLISEKILLVDFDQDKINNYILELQEDLKNIIELYKLITNNPEEEINNRVYLIKNDLNKNYTDSEIARNFSMNFYNRLLKLHIMRYKSYDSIFIKNPEYWNNVKDKINDIDLIKKWQHLDDANKFDIL